MRVEAIMGVIPYSYVNPQTRYYSQDIMVNSTGSNSLNRSYRDVNNPIHVEPAAKLYLSPEALEHLNRTNK